MYGISLVGVGSGTTMEYIQIHDNADDGIEYYGGTVDTKYLVVTGAGDETLRFWTVFPNQKKQSKVSQLAPASIASGRCLGGAHS